MVVPICSVRYRLTLPLCLQSKWRQRMLVRARHSLEIHRFIQYGMTHGLVSTVYTGFAAGAVRQRDTVIIYSGRGVGGAGLCVCLCHS